MDKFYIYLLFFATFFTSYAQHDVAVGKTINIKEKLPCNVSLQLKCKRLTNYISPQDKDFRAWDSIRDAAEAHCDLFYKDSILCFKADHLSGLRIVLFFCNNSQTDTIYLEIPFDDDDAIHGDDGAVTLELYRKENNGLVPDNLYNSLQHTANPINASPMSCDSAYRMVIVDETKIYTGVYAIRGRFIQRCNSITTIKYTNYAYFRIIK